MKKQILLATAALGVVLGGAQTAGAIPGQAEDMNAWVSAPAQIDGTETVTHLGGVALAVKGKPDMAKAARDICENASEADVMHMRDAHEADGFDVTKMMTGNLSAFRGKIDADAAATVTTMALLDKELTKFAAQPAASAADNRKLKVLLDEVLSKLGYTGLAIARVKEGIGKLRPDGSDVTMKSAIDNVRSEWGTPDGSDALTWTQDTLNKRLIGDSAKGSTTEKRIEGAQEHVGQPASETETDLNRRLVQAKKDLKDADTSVTVATKETSKLVKEDATASGNATLHAQVTEASKLLNGEVTTTINAKALDIGKKLDGAATDATEHALKKLEAAAKVVNGAAIAADAAENLRKKIDDASALLTGTAATGADAENSIAGASGQIQDIAGVVNGLAADATLHLRSKVDAASALLTGTPQDGLTEVKSIAGAGGQIQQIGALVDGAAVVGDTNENLKKKIEDASDLLVGADNTATGASTALSLAGGTDGQIHDIAKLVDGAAALTTAEGCLKGKVDAVLTSLKGLDSRTDKKIVLTNEITALTAAADLAEAVAALVAAIEDV